MMALRRLPARPEAQPLPRARCAGITRVAAAIVLLQLAGLGAGAASSDRSYAVRLIAPELLKDAHAVVREDVRTFRVYDREKARLTVLRTVTVLDARGRGNGFLQLWYDRFRTIKDLEGRILDQDGEEVRELQESDLHDVPTPSSFSLYEDTRSRTAELYFDRYPYTVEFSYEIAYDGFLRWPGWCAQEDEEAVEHSRYTIQLPEGETLRYWTNADSVRPLERTEDGLRQYSWEVSGLPKHSPEMMEEEIAARTLVVCPAPSLFQLEDYPGEMTSWKSLGAWTAGLFKGRDVLPEGAKQDVRALVQPSDPPREKAVKLYRYMQGRTRYVSVQQGIGGVQPFDAAYVHERGYGDCKALSNYMVALLREAGVTAYPVLIHSGRPGELYVEEFPSDQFNHVIVCVPLGQDSLWLECTSQTRPAGHLGRYTENRFALLLRPEGGELVHTPRSRAGENLQVRTAQVRLSAMSYVEATVTTRSTGNQQDEVRQALAEASAEEQQKWLIENVQVPAAQLGSFTVKGLEAGEAHMTVSMALRIPRYGSLTGTRLFFEPNLAERRTSIPRNLPSRRSPVCLPYAYRDVDTVTYQLPAGYGVETLPGEVHLAASFGAFRARTVQAGNGTLVYTRLLEVTDPVVPAARYGEYRKFFADVVKADRAQAVLVRKEGAGL